MNNKYEVIEYPDPLPIRTYFHSLDSFRMHWHQEMEILLVLKGSIHVLIQNTTYTIEEGELIVVSPNTIHATQQTEEPNNVLLLQINCGRFGFNDANIDSLAVECAGGPESHPQIAILRQCVCSVMLEMIHKQSGYLYHAAAHVQMILGILLRHFPHRAEATLETVKAKDRERIHRIFDYINTNYAGKVTLTDLAAREYLSVSHLSTFIHKTIGMSFGDYLSSVRLKAYLECLQTDASTPLDDIAEQCGFSSPQFASSLFFKTYRTTPGKYRKQLQQKNAFKLEALSASEGEGYVSLYRPTDLSAVLRYANEAQERPDPNRSAERAEEIERISAAAAQGRYHRSCLSITAIGRAYEGLLSHVQDRLRTLQREIGFTHLRFHGIFSDEMMILKPDETGSIHYSWRLVDLLFDFMLSIGLRPFVEFSYMPSLFASGTATVFAWRGNITPPANMDAWRALVDAFLAHCVARYGAGEVTGWMFEVWNEPDYLGVSWGGTEQEYFHLYAETAAAVKRRVPGARVMGPSATLVGIEKRWPSAFMEYVKRNQAPLDAFSMHAYSEILDGNSLRGQLQDMLRERHSIAPAHPLLGQNYAQHMIALARRQLGEAPLPVVVSEWNLTMALYNPINDSAFAGTSLLSTALACDASDTLLAHWTTTDYFEEQRTLPPEEFFGGFGLMTTNGIRKASYWAMWALARLGEEIVARPARGIVTRSGGRYALLAIHHPETKPAYDMAYAHDHGALREQGDVRFDWRVEGLTGVFRAKRYRYDPARCDGKTLLAAKGFREPLSAEDASYLVHAAQPVRSESVLRAEGDAVTVSFFLPPCGFELVELIPEG